MNSRNRNFKVTVLCLLVSTNIVMAGAESVQTLTRAQEKCETAVNSTKALKDLIFDTKYGEEGKKKSLKDLEIEKRKLMAKKAIYKTLSELKEQKEKFNDRLNPNHSDSFFNANKGFKENYQSVQREIVSNQILSTIGGSVNLVVNNPGFKLELQATANKLHSESIQGVISSGAEAVGDAFSNAIDKILDKKQKKNSPTIVEDYPITYDAITSLCTEKIEKIKQSKVATDKTALAENTAKDCTDFLSINKKILSGIDVDNNFIKGVTNQFYKAVHAAGNTDTKTIEEIRDSSLLKNMSNKYIKQLQKDNKYLTNAVYEFSSKSKPTASGADSSRLSADGIRANLGNGFSGITLNDDEEYKKFKNCMAKEVFTGSDATGKCRGSNSSKYNELISAVSNYGNSKTVKAANVVKDLEDSMKNFAKNNYNKKLFKDEDKSFFTDEKKNPFIVKSLNLLTDNKNGVADILNEVCSFDGSKKFNSIQDNDISAQKEKLWDCMENIKLSGDKFNKTISSLDKGIGAVNKEIAQHKGRKEFKDYNELLKYSSFLAKKECDTNETKIGFQSCGDGNNSFISMTIGGEELLTSLTDLDWKLSGEGKAEEFLKPMIPICHSIVSKSDEAKSKKGSSPVTRPSKAQVAAIQLKAKSSDALTKVCKEVKKDYKSIQDKIPSPKLVRAHRDYNFKYNSAKGKMDKTERRSWTTNVGSSLAKSALNNGLPMLLSNAQFKNGLGYSTDMAIYKKNQMYLMNNPEYMFSGSYFSGYGMSGYPNYYGAPSYYGF